MATTLLASLPLLSGSVDGSLWGADFQGDVLDLDRHRFNDIGIGSNSVDVRRRDHLEHFDVVSTACERSVEIGTEGETVDYILVNWRDPEAPELPAFTGRIRYAGRLHPLTTATTKVEVLSILGPPYWIDEDADETILFYEFGEIEWQIEFDENEFLKVLLVATPPLLEDPEQRRAYGVTRDWPPTGGHR